MKELAAIVKIWKDISFFAAAFVRVPFGSMTYDVIPAPGAGKKFD